MTEALKKSDSVKRPHIGEVVALPMMEENHLDTGITKRFMPIEEASDQLGLSVYFLRQGIRSGWIPHIRCGCKAMINISKLIEILDAESVTANADK